ncbi:hypothetical protein [Caldisericum exile]|uniref:Tetratricopeptide repeat protein n=1 Tax=Caldisericum exile (strain DSM 21853 / NBRC 104410 / AZM16c01) TaxID=511051 RepID=A0A7U6GDF4_CALEA|nr:hypothetical protein [Caldisericum exile]BAL80378.1 hypothetical protein CSE_02520 [Caldisericum exile AZM16c01]
MDAKKLAKLTYDEFIKSKKAMTENINIEIDPLANVIVNFDYYSESEKHEILQRLERVSPYHYYLFKSLMVENLEDKIEFIDKAKEESKKQKIIYIDDLAFAIAKLEYLLKKNKDTDRIDEETAKQIGKEAHTIYKKTNEKDFGEMALHYLYIGGHKETALRLMYEMFRKHKNFSHKFYIDAINVSLTFFDTETATKLLSIAKFVLPKKQYAIVLTNYFYRTTDNIPDQFIKEAYENISEILSEPSNIEYFAEGLFKRGEYKEASNYYMKAARLYLEREKEDVFNLLLDLSKRCYFRAIESLALANNKEKARKILEDAKEYYPDITETEISALKKEYNL